MASDPITDAYEDVWNSLGEHTRAGPSYSDIWAGTGHQPPTARNHSTMAAAAAAEGGGMSAGAGQAAGAAAGGFFGFLGGLSHDIFGFETAKSDREQNAANFKMGIDNSRYLQQQGYNNALGLQNNEAGLQFGNFQKEVGMREDALKSMGLPGGVWALGGGTSNLPTTTQMTSSGSYVKSAFPGDPTVTALTGSTVQQQFGWGNYTS